MDHNKIKNQVDNRKRFYDVVSYVPVSVGMISQRNINAKEKGLSVY